MATIFQKTISNAFHAKEILYLCQMKFATVKPIRHLFGAKPLYEPINSPPPPPPLVPHICVSGPGQHWFR